MYVHHSPAVPATKQIITVKSNVTKVIHQVIIKLHGIIKIDGKDYYMQNYTVYFVSLGFFENSFTYHIY